MKLNVTVFAALADQDHEQVVFCQDPPVGLRAIIAVHSTRLGPALGGTRFYPYRSDDEALADALRLSRAMTYKSAAAGLDLGGGKAVIIGDPAELKSEALLRSFARHVDSLGGRFVTGEDVGTSLADMDLMSRETSRVVGLSPEMGGSGDPSPATALGVVHAMRAVAAHVWGDERLSGRKIVVSGLGKVGWALCELLAGEGAEVVVANRTAAVAEKAAAELGVATTPYDGCHRVACDIWAPCALGGVVNAATVPELGCRTIVGSANNQLVEPGCAKALADAGVLYCPDYVANAGGVTNVADELAGYSPDRARLAIARIRRVTAAVLDSAAKDGITTVAAADQLAEARIRSLGAIALAPTRAIRR